MSFSIPGYIGRQTFRSANHILNLFAFGYRITRIFLRPVVGDKTHLRRVVLEQIYFSCIKALPIIIPASLLIGAMLIAYFSKVPEEYALGRVAVLLIIREIGPVVTALLIILHSATALTIEVCSMCDPNDFQIHKSTGIDLMKEVCFPRVVGVIAATLCLFIVFDLTAILGGYAVVWAVSYLSVGGFLTQVSKAVMLLDITVGVIKALFFGIIISIICLYQGLSAKTRDTGISKAASQAAVQCFIYCLIANVAISVVFYW
jgi:phospholipid/cholesterol/gamma-HCH transport system permease protein